MQCVWRSRAYSALARAGVVVWLPLACTVAAAPPAEQVEASLSDREASLLMLADRLETGIDAGTATEQDRLYVYHQARERGAHSAEDALAYAMIAGRLAQLRGLAAGKLIREVEQYARSSIELDPTLRNGAAKRLLGTLYVMAPPSLLDAGDSEMGIELLEEVVEQWPDQAQNRLRLAEAYVALDDPQPAVAHLCWLSRKRSRLRRADAELFFQLRDRVELRESDCKREGCSLTNGAGCP